MSKQYKNNGESNLTQKENSKNKGKIWSALLFPSPSSKRLEYLMRFPREKQTN